MNNELIHALALKNPRSIKEMGEIPGLKKWLEIHFGQEILAAQTSGTWGRPCGTPMPSEN
jgi:hypothetical protein